MEPDKVLEIFKSLQKDGSLAKIISEDAAKKVPTSSSSELDKFLSTHTTVTLRLRAHLFHILSGCSASKDATDSILIEELEGDNEGDSQDDSSSRVHVLASSPLPEASYVPALLPSQRRVPGFESQREHLLLLIDVLLKALTDTSAAAGETRGVAGGAIGSAAVKQSGGGAVEEGMRTQLLLLKTTRERLMLNDSAFSDAKQVCRPRKKKIYAELTHLASTLTKPAVCARERQKERERERESRTPPNPAFKM